MICKLLSFQVSNRLAFGLGKKAKIDVQDEHRGGHLGFRIGTILACVGLQAVLIFPTRFRLIWPLSSGKEEQNRFSRWPPRRLSWISDRYDSIYIWSAGCPENFLPCFEWTGLVLEKKPKEGFQDGGHHGFPIGTILAIFDLQVTLMLPTKFRVDFFEPWFYINFQDFPV